MARVGIVGSARRLLRDVPAARRAHTLLSTTARREERDGRHLRLLLAVVLGRDANCVDVGAHSGGVLEEVVRLAPEGRHIAFEPLPEFAEELRRRFPSVEVRQCALSDHGGTEQFVRVRARPAYSGFKARGAEADELERFEVPTVRLDDALPEGYVPDLVKIDVEGAEREVFAGAMETLSRHQPVVVFEHGRGGAPYYSTRSDDVFALVCGQAGLRLFDLDGNGPFDADMFARIFERGDRWNFVARR